MTEVGEGAASGGAVSTPAESTSPAARREDGSGERIGSGDALPGWFGPGSAGLVTYAAVVAAISAWRYSVAEAVVFGLLGAALSRRWRAGAVIGALALTVTLRAGTEHRALVPDTVGEFTGWATVVADPRPAATSMRVVLQLDGQRFETWVRGRAARLRVERWQHGDVVWVDGERRALSRQRAVRVAWQHVVGEFRYDALGDRLGGRRLDVASNRVRALIEQATSGMAHDQAALARGLIIGDDTDQPDEMVERFRASGLSHLTAVSGQNVALVLAAAGPLLRRARPLPKLVATLGLIGWFVVLTRAEPSVLRAGAMAALAAVAFAVGSEREPARLLSLAVVALLVVDPLLVRSVGFWLSVGATAGVTVIGPRLRPRFASLGPLATPMAMTVGAQAGVVVPSLLVFGRLPLSGTVANLVAVPVAGMVMLYGLPASIVAGAVPALRGVLMAPVAVGVSAVDAAATVAAGLENRPPLNVAVPVTVIGLVVALSTRRSRDDDSRAFDRCDRLRQ